MDGRGRLATMIVAFAAALGMLHQGLSPARGEATTSCGRSLDPTGEWPVQSPEQAGFDPAVLCSLDAKLDRSPELNVHGVVVMRGGKLVYETYRAGDDWQWGMALGVIPHDAATLHDVRSVSKSVVSLLVGIVIDRGLIAGIDEPIFTLLPDYAALRTAENGRILLRHLLTMTSGLRWNEDLPYANPGNTERLMYEAADPYRYVLEQKVVHEPDRWWQYNSGSTMLLSAVLQQATGKSLPEFAREALFNPLGIEEFDWVRVRPSGESAAGGGLRLRPRDMAKLGQLVLDGGAWQGHQIVSAAWVKQSTEPRFDGWRPNRYGYQWWIGRSTRGIGGTPWIAGWGLGGQRLFIVPSLELVVAITAGLYQSSDQDNVVMDVFDNNVLAAVRR